MQRWQPAVRTSLNSKFEQNSQFRGNLAGFYGDQRSCHGSYWSDCHGNQQKFDGYEPVAMQPKQQLHTVSFYK